MAGAIWGAARGVDALPRCLVSRLEQSAAIAQNIQRNAERLDAIGKQTTIAQHAHADSQVVTAVSPT